jgi:hypothetical protein
MVIVWLVVCKKEEEWAKIMSHLEMAVVFGMRATGQSIANNGDERQKARCVMISDQELSEDTSEHPAVTCVSRCRNRDFTLLLVPLHSRTTNRSLACSEANIRRRRHNLSTHSKQPHSTKTQTHTERKKRRKQDIKQV